MVEQQFFVSFLYVRVGFFGGFFLSLAKRSSKFSPFSSIISSLILGSSFGLEQQSCYQRAVPWTHGGSQKISVPSSIKHFKHMLFVFSLPSGFTPYKEDI